MITVNFIGDISLNNKYQSFRENNNSPFEDVEGIFANADFNIGNLECLCSEDSVSNRLKVPRLRTRAITLDLLKPLHFDMLNLAHNHIYDSCHAGITCTIFKLQSLNILPIGFQLDHEVNPYLWETSIKGMPFAIITALHHDTNPCLPDNLDLNIPHYNVEKIIAAINIAKNKDCFVAVYLHWGGRTEKGFMPDWYEIQDAHRFIDEGADVIIGGHSHTIQPFEKYNGKYIFYSLGNFCFDDVETDGKLYPIGRYRKRKGLITTLHIQENTYQYKITVQRIRNKNGFIYKQHGKLKLILRNFRFKLLEHCKPLWKFNFCWFRKISPLFIYLFESTDSLKIKLSKFKLKRVLLLFKS